jgi:hypothetical protein
MQGVVKFRPDSTKASNELVKEADYDILQPPERIPTEITPHEKVPLCPVPQEKVLLQLGNS